VATRLPIIRVVHFYICVYNPTSSID
jgi:hypothetical protein